MKILVINSGSSSLKFTLLEYPNQHTYISGMYERIGETGTNVSYTIHENKKKKETPEIENHQDAIEAMITLLFQEEIIVDTTDIHGIGHRVVHGGVYFSEAVTITQEVKEKIELCGELAPLHNPANLAGIVACEKHFPSATQVALFDTAFHQTIPEENYTYAIPKRFYEKYGVRKYGFHGLSHKYVSERAKEILGDKAHKIISCHVGNGASIAAIHDGKCVNTSMGFTPLDGLAMGTRCGLIDPSVVLYLQEKENLSASEMSVILNRKSGMLGLSGETSNIKDIEDGIREGNEVFEKALNMYIARIARFIGMYTADLGGVDTIVFTAGVLENSYDIRRRIAEKLAYLGLEFDGTKNDFRGEKRIISSHNSKVTLIVIPTDEEHVIATEVYEKLN